MKGLCECIPFLYFLFVWESFETAVHCGGNYPINIIRANVLRIAPSREKEIPTNKRAIKIQMDVYIFEKKIAFSENNQPEKSFNYHLILTNFSQSSANVSGCRQQVSPLTVYACWIIWAAYFESDNGVGMRTDFRPKSCRPTFSPELCGRTLSDIFLIIYCKELDCTLSLSSSNILKNLFEYYNDYLRNIKLKLFAKR